MILLTSRHRFGRWDHAQFPLGDQGELKEGRNQHQKNVDCLCIHCNAFHRTSILLFYLLRIVNLVFARSASKWIIKSGKFWGFLFVTSVLSRIVKTDRIPNTEYIQFLRNDRIPKIFGFWKWSNTEYRIVILGRYYSNSSNSIQIVPILIRNRKYNIMQKYVSLPIHYGFCTKN